MRVEQPRCRLQTTRCASAAWQGEKRPTAATTRLPPTQTLPRSLPRRAAALQKRCSCARARWLALSTLRSTPVGARSSCCSKASAASRTASRRASAKITRTKPKNEMRLRARTIRRPAAKPYARRCAGGSTWRPDPTCVRALHTLRCCVINCTASAPTKFTPVCRDAEESDTCGGGGWGRRES